MTVSQLLTGKPGPLSSKEFMEWTAFWKVRKAKQDQARRQQESTQNLRSRGRGRSGRRR